MLFQFYMLHRAAVCHSETIDETNKMLILYEIVHFVLE